MKIYLNSLKNKFQKLNFTRKKFLYLVIIIICSFPFLFLYFTRISFDDIKTNQQNYLKNLQYRMEEKGLHFTLKQLNDNLIFIDELYKDKAINIPEIFFYYPEKWQTFSYREQYLINFAQ